MAQSTTRRRFLLEMGGLAALAGCAAIPKSAAAPATRRPNIVFIMADDLGYGDVFCYGAPDVNSPSIDRLASQGVSFTSYYSNGPECTPTRTALMTGRYQHRVGGMECAIGTGNVGRYDDAIRLANAHDLGLPVEETSIARMLKDAGYRTAIAGKWHLGYEPKFSPNRHGFDYAFYLQGGGADYFHRVEEDGRPVLYQNEKQIEREGYTTDLFTQEAVGYIQRQDGSAPFFLYVPYTSPHEPIQGPDDYHPKAYPEPKGGTRETYAAMIERMDQGIGAILRALDEKGLAPNTLVVFTSDNGGTGKLGRNAPYSGGKGGLFEGGIRVPCVIRWPGALPAAIETDYPTLSMDLTNSLVRIGGAQPPAGRSFDGIDVLKDIQEGRPAPKRTLFWRQRRGDRTWRAVRDGSLKYISEENAGKRSEYLFDLAADAAEKKNLLAERSDDVARLKALLAAWEEEVKPRR